MKSIILFWGWNSAQGATLSRDASRLGTVSGTRRPDWTRLELDSWDTVIATNNQSDIYDPKSMGVGNVVKFWPFASPCYSRAWISLTHFKLLIFPHITTLPTVCLSPMLAVSHPHFSWLHSYPTRTSIAHIPPLHSISESGLTRDRHIARTPQHSSSCAPAWWGRTT